MSAINPANVGQKPHSADPQLKVSAELGKKTGQVEMVVSKTIQKKEGASKISSTTSRDSIPTHHEDPAAAAKFPKKTYLERTKGSRNLGSKAPTQVHVDNFMKGFNLVNLPVQKVSIGLGDLRKASTALSQAVDNPNPPPIPKESTIDQLFNSMQPYYKEYSSIEKFSKENGKVFEKFVSRLPSKSEVAEMDKQLGKAKETFDTKPAHLKGKGLAELEQNLKNFKQKAALKEQIGPEQLDVFLSKPHQHQRVYLEQIGEFRKYLDRGDTEGMKVTAGNMLTMEENFHRSMDVLVKVMSDPDFRSATDPNEVQKIKRLAEEIKAESAQTLKLVKEFNQSVQKDPQGWIDALPNK